MYSVNFTVHSVSFLNVTYILRYLMAKCYLADNRLNLFMLYARECMEL